MTTNLKYEKKLEKLDWLEEKPIKIWGYTYTSEIIERILKNWEEDYYTVALSLEKDLVNNEELEQIERLMTILSS
jgi:3-hydroxy-3-methylglutaryl CoA synthase